MGAEDAGHCAGGGIAGAAERRSDAGRSLRNLQHQNFGFDPRAATWYPSIPMLAGYKQEQLVPLFRQIQDRLSAIPGVRGVSAATYAPMSGDSGATDIRIQGKPEPGPKDDVSAGWTRITPGFFDTIGARMLAGRPITEDDNGNTRSVAVINEAFAKRFLEARIPSAGTSVPAPVKNAGTYEIVGVFETCANYVDEEPNRPMYYIPEAQTVHFDQLDLQSRGALVAEPLQHRALGAGHPANISCK